MKAKAEGPLDPGARQAGVGFAHGSQGAVVVVAYGNPDVEVEAFERIIDQNGGLSVRGRVLIDSDGLFAYANEGERGVRRCVLDPAVALPKFAFRCELAADDDAAWVQLVAVPRGRVLAQEVLAVLALRTPEAASLYSSRKLGEPRPVSDIASFRDAVLETLNGIRSQAGMVELKLATKQSDAASQVTPAFFAAMLDGGEQAQHVVDGISLGLMAGWDVTGGMIRDGNMTAGMVIDSLDAERWLSDVLERPVGRAVLLADDARVLAIGALRQQQPSVLAAVALTYAFFEPEATPGERAMQVLERLGRVRQARGLGRTVLVSDAPGMQEQLARIQRGEADPSEALRAAMQVTAADTGGPVQGFVWETHDLDTIEFPPELLRKGDLTLGAGVTYYKAPGGAWGQYTVLFVLIRPPGAEV